MFESLARLADGHARRVALVAVAFFLLAGGLGGSVASHLDPYGADDPATESPRPPPAPGQRLPRHRPHRAGGQRPGALRLARQQVEGVAREIRRSPQVDAVTGYYDTGSRAFVSRDGSKTYLAVSLRPTEDKAWQDAAKSIDDRLAGRPGVMVGGPAMAQEQVNKQVEQDLRMAELLAFPLLFLLSLLFFRSLVAALLPLMIGALAIVGTFLTLRIASEVGSISIFALNLTTGLGLGLAIDYSLFIVSRYREEIAKDGPGLAAMRRTLATAGRTVLFSSLTVSAALFSLLVFPQRFLYSMGLGGGIVALLAATIALTVLPAVLTLLGTRVNSLSPALPAPPRRRRRAPGRGGLLVPALPLRDAPPGPDRDPQRALPDRARDPLLQHQVHRRRRPHPAHRRERPAGLRHDPGRVPALPRHAGPGRRRRRRGEGRPPGPRRGLRVRGSPRCCRPPGSATASPSSRRSRPAPTPRRRASRQWSGSGSFRAAGQHVQVTGASADFVDFQGSLVRHLPIAFGIIVTATLVILFLMTGSVVLPVKSLLMNVLNLSAVFGLLVLIFQDGRFEGLLLQRAGSARADHADPALRGRLRALHRLRGLPALADQGGAGRRRADSEAVAIGLERTGPS